MIVILASAPDGAARSLAASWPEAVVMTPQDLSVAGWRHDPLQPRNDVAMIGGVRVACRDIRGVVTRLTRVTPDDLAHVIEEDRGYVAAEMTAFLVSWLSSLRCPVMNPASAVSLAGPAWRRERWLHAAARAGLAAGHAAEAEVVVTVVGKECVGAPDPALAALARRLAALAGANLLELGLAREGEAWTLVHATPWPDLLAPEVREALRVTLEAA